MVRNEGIRLALTTRQKLQALEELLRRVDENPRDPRSRLRAGDLLQQLGRTDEALVQYREAFALFQRLGFEKQARAARSLVLRLRPDDEAMRRTLQYETDLALAVTQVPLDREVRAGAEKDVDADFPAEKALKNGHTFLLATEDVPPPAPAAKKDADGDLPAVKGKPVVEVVDGNVVVLFPEPKTVATAPPEIVVTVDTADLKPDGRPRDRRGEPRVDVVDGVARVFRGAAGATGVLEEVSANGLFVSGPRLFEPGDLVDLALKLPRTDWVGTARARVMRSVEGTKRRGAGLGLALLWADAPTERWLEEYIAAAYGQEAALPEPVPPPEKWQDDIRRAFPRAGVRFPCVVRSSEFEITGWAKDLSVGGSFVEVPRVFGAGKRVEVVLWLPASPAPFLLEAVVAHDIKPKPGEHRGGLGLRFIRVSDAIAEALATAAALPPVGS